MAVLLAQKLFIFNIKKVLDIYLFFCMMGTNNGTLTQIVVPSPKIEIEIFGTYRLTGSTRARFKCKKLLGGGKFLNLNSGFNVFPRYQKTHCYHF